MQWQSGPITNAVAERPDCATRSVARFGLEPVCRDLSPCPGASSKALRFLSRGGIATARERQGPKQGDCLSQGQLCVPLRESARTPTVSTLFGDIMDEESWRRHHGERHHGGGIKEESSRRSHQGGILEVKEASWRLSGGWCDHRVTMG